MKEDITYSALNRTSEMLIEFVFELERLFSKSAMTYNIHQMLHITRSVVNWGSLWAHSAYAFETGNHVLLQAIHCAKGVNQQMVRFVNI